MEAKVYTAHSSDCTRKKDRYWRGCNCRKWIYVAVDRRRIPAKTRSWQKAEELARQMETDAAEAEEKAKKLAAGEPVAPDRQTVDAAIDHFLHTKKKVKNVSDGTMSKLNTIFDKQMREFCAAENLVYVDQLKLQHLEKFRSTWTDEPLAMSKKQERVKGFFRYCVKHEWIAKDPCVHLDDVTVPPYETNYFDKQEFAKVLDAIPLMYMDGRGNNGNAEGLRKRVEAMVLTLRWSGLRIRDGVCLERIRLKHDGKLLLRMTKTKQPVFTKLPPHAVKLLQELPNSNPKYFFWTGNGLPKSAVADWQRVLRRMFKLAELGKRAHPQMFRDTFAIEYLLAGVPLDQVSRLLGHASIKTTEKHYAPWVKARQDQLETSIEDAWKIMFKK
jgi:integrase/recombinase XerD